MLKRSSFVHLLITKVECLFLIDEFYLQDNFRIVENIDVLSAIILKRQYSPVKCVVDKSYKSEWGIKCGMACFLDFVRHEVTAP